MLWTSAAQRGPVGLLLRCWPLTSCHTAAAAPRWPLLASRHFSSSEPAKAPTHDGAEASPLRQWALDVSPFTTVRARLRCNICVRPLDVHAYPEANRALISVHGPDSDRGGCTEDLHVHYDGQSQELLISAERVNSDVTIEMDAPIKTNLFITTEGGGNVQVKRMESDVCKVQTEKGSCLLHSVKGHQVEVRSHSGHVTGLGTIHGNVDISTKGDSVVDVKKLQGTRMNISTEHGALKVKAVYAESSRVFSCSGRVELGHVHGNATVENKSGDTVVDGSNSFLKVSSISGSIDVYVGDGGTADLHTQDGAVSVRVPSSLRAGVNLCGTAVNVSPEVLLHDEQRHTADGRTTLTGYMSGEPPDDQWVKARTDRGSVQLRTQSWFESLKLGS
ncbi:protein FAM185A [Poeciliopsis prolifica]|uniref:protein FAM185A n=1 Tax=Poeciliopsis prolifica TaxID=188132 RepID=UPI002413B783|nr:protein FAM185A [Poeciliopsis prolifica]